MRRSFWSASLAAVLCAVFLLRPADEEAAVDRVLVSGPRRGAFFSCGCARDRRGGMTLARAHVQGELLWVETGDAFRDERAAIERFLSGRIANWRVESEGPRTQRVTFRDGRVARLVFVDRFAPDELESLDDKAPLLCVSAAFDPVRWAALRGRRGLYLAGDGARRAPGTLRLVGFDGLEGRQVVSVDSRLNARVIDVRPIPGRAADPLDLEYLAARHREAGVLRPGKGLAPPEAGNPEACAACHPATVARWRKSRHAHALEDLPSAAARTCYGCHSVLRNKPPRSAARFAVSCASCHGIAAGHPGNDEPLRSARCSGCHTRTSSPGFDQARYWPRVRCGPTPAASTR